MNATERIELMEEIKAAKLATDATQATLVEATAANDEAELKVRGLVNTLLEEIVA